MRISLLDNLRILFLIIAISIIVGCATNHTIATQTSGMKEPAGKGKLIGTIVRGPTSPVGRPDMPHAAEPAPGIKLLILTTTGQQIGSVVSDTQGMYSIILPPGTYRIEITSLTGIEFTKSLPATVIIREGQETRLDIFIDTGMR